LRIDRIERRAGHPATVLEQRGDLRVVGANRQRRNALDNDDIAKAHTELQRTNWGLLHEPLTSSTTVRHSSCRTAGLAPARSSIGSSQKR
jgi:hypothetical protein